MGTINLTKADFLTKVANFEASKEWKYLGDKPAIIDFYADWCGPCKMIAPILEDLAKDYDGQIHIYKVNTDKEQDLAVAFGIQSIPTLLFINSAGEQKVFRGAMPKADLKDKIDKILLNK